MVEKLTLKGELLIPNCLEFPLFDLHFSNKIHRYLLEVNNQLYFKDEGTMDDANAYNGGNAGLVLRYGYTQESKVFELEGNLMEDIYDIDKYLINGVDIYIKLFRSSAPFLIMSAQGSPVTK